MIKLRIKSNPYRRNISYASWDADIGDWKDIGLTSDNSKLRETDSERSFLPFKIKDIVDIIIREYYVGREAIELVFEGTQDEYAEVASICEKEDIKDKINLTRSPIILENARFIKSDIKEIFEKVQPVIEGIIKDDARVINDLHKVSNALDDIIPICVFGNYSAGKSTFINSLIGAEVLPSGGDPVTAKIFEIRQSNQLDKAQIIFEHHGDKIVLSIEGGSFRVLSGDQSCSIVTEITAAIEAENTKELYDIVRIAINLINSYEKRNRETLEIGDVITLEVPFKKNGVLAASTNNFVIFDTPGSNSNSNADHSVVLAKAMDDFSNGVPIWVSIYEAIDSDDNATLCDKVLGIKALDKRFTMIVLNKADGSDLEEGGFSKSQEKEILEYKAVEKMYAGGIFFVSSIMGLGAKNDGNMIDKFYRKTYRAQYEMYSDPDDIDYMSLFKYNIMPDQIKRNAIEYSKAEENIVYANSGLYCIEREIENFGTRHSAYNKCQMVLSFLNDVIGQANERITAKEQALETAREKSSKELDEKAVVLEETIEETAESMIKEFERSSKVDIKEYVNSDLTFRLDSKKLGSFDENKRTESLDKNNFWEKELAYEENIDKLWEHLKESRQGLFKRNIVETVKAVANDVSKDIKDIRDSKNDMDSTEKELDREVSDNVINHVIHIYRNTLDNVQDQLDSHLDEYWKERELETKRALIREITASDALNTEERGEISELIQNYASAEFKDDPEKIFVKKKFLKGAILGIQLGDSEKLDTGRLTARYNDSITKAVEQMSQEMNTSCFVRFKTWGEKLLGVIEANLTEYNPELRSIAELIRTFTDEITKLESDRHMIKSSFEAINDLMSWKEA